MNDVPFGDQKPTLILLHVQPMGDMSCSACTIAVAVVVDGELQLFGQASLQQDPFAGLDLSAPELAKAANRMQQQVAAGYTHAAKLMEALATNLLKTDTVLIANSTAAPNLFRAAALEGNESVDVIAASMLAASARGQKVIADDACPNALALFPESEINLGKQSVGAIAATLGRMGLQMPELDHPNFIAYRRPDYPAFTVYAPSADRPVFGSGQAA